MKKTIFEKINQSNIHACEIIHDYTNNLYLNKVLHPIYQQLRKIIYRQRIQSLQDPLMIRTGLINYDLIPDNVNILDTRSLSNYIKRAIKKSGLERIGNITVLR